jgi:hypothetical protein
MIGPIASSRRWIRRLIVAIVFVVLPVVGGPYKFVHFIERPPPAKLSLPKTVTTQ